MERRACKQATGCRTRHVSLPHTMGSTRAGGDLGRRVQSASRALHARGGTSPLAAASQQRTGLQAPTVCATHTRSERHDPGLRCWRCRHTQKGRTTTASWIPGAVATQGGGVGEIFRIGGQIVARRTPNVKTTTGNLANLVAFARALQWAHSNYRARGRPICIRYNSEYAARIATGAWRAKKHKSFAEEARRAWAQLKRDRGGRAYFMDATRLE